LQGQEKWVDDESGAAIQNKPMVLSELRNSNHRGETATYL
jgi:hypothetical protein